jgi:hypothetical protein
MKAGPEDEGLPMRKKYRVLLIVVLGIGILAAVLAPKFFDVTEEEKYERAVSDVAALRQAGFLWWIDELDSPAADSTGDWISALESSGYEFELVSSDQNLRVFHTRKVDP